MERLSVDSSFSGHGMEEMNSLRGLWSLGGGAFTGMSLWWERPPGLQKIRRGSHRLGHADDIAPD